MARRTLTIAFLLSLALLVTAELVMRIAFSRNMSGRFEYGYHPTAGFEENSSGQVRLVRAGGRRFHPQTFSIEPARDNLRIMTVGDSVPRGPSLETSYPVQVANELSKSGCKAEGWNLSLPGYGVKRNQIVLAKALKYHPNIVLLHINDSNEFEDDREYKRAQEYFSWHPRNWLKKSLLIGRLYEAKTEKLFWKLPFEVRNQNAVNDADAEIQAMTSKGLGDVWRRRVDAVSRESFALCQSNNVQVIAVLQCKWNKATNTLETIDVPELIGFLKEKNIPTLLMKDALEREDWQSMFNDSSHLNAKGHQILAQALAAKIKSLLHRG